MMPGAYNLGNALIAMGDSAEAEAVYQKALALKPDVARFITIWALLVMSYSVIQMLMKLSCSESGCHQR